MATHYFEQMMMDDIMHRWPATIRVILRYRLLCVGCPVAAFHTVEEAIREHQIDGTRFRRELHAAVERSSGLSRHLSRD